MSINHGHMSLDRVLAEARREAKLNAYRNHVRGLQPVEPFVADLRVCGCTELLGSGIKPTCVITEPSRSRARLDDFSELARACVDVPLIAVFVDQRFLPDVLQRLCQHLKYRSARALGKEPQGSCQLLLLFCQRDDAFRLAQARSPISTKDGWPGWHRYLVETLAGPGELVCDPFMKNSVALAALEYGRRFVGGSVDAAVVDKTRQEIESESAWRRGRRTAVPAPNAPVVGGDAECQHSAETKDCAEM